MRINDPLFFLLLLCATVFTSTQTSAHLVVPPRTHPHIRPLPQNPPPVAPSTAPDPIRTFTFDPIQTAAGTAIALSAGAFGWLLAHRRRKRLLTSLATLTDQLIQRNATITTLEHTLDRRSQEIAEADRHRRAAEASLRAFQAEAIRHKAERRETWRLAEAQREQTDVASAVNQLRFVSEAILFPRELLNREEQIVFRAALRAIQTVNKAFGSNRYGLSLQVSMGEFLGTAGKEVADRAYSSIGCKRSDLLIYTRADFLPALVIEHQGSGHDQGKARERDAVKRAALARAGLPLLETISTDFAVLYREITAKLDACFAPRTTSGRSQPPRT